MNQGWNDPTFAKEYAEKLDQVDWYEHEVNMPSLISLIPDKTKTILDFGSGPGQFTALLADKYDAKGADASAAMVDIAAQAYPHIHFQQWDGQSPYPDDQQFDLLFSKLTVHFVKDLTKFAQYAHQILQKGGSMVLSLPHPIRTIPKVDGNYALMAPYDNEIGQYRLHVEMIHRSFEAYTRPFLENGFVLTGLLEPTVSKEQAAQHDVPEVDCYIPKRLNLRFKRV